MIYLEEIGKKLKEARREKKLSQKEVGEAIFLDRSVISKMENGQFTGSLKLLNRYLTFLGFKLTIEQEKPNFPQLDDLASIFND